LNGVLSTLNDGGLCREAVDYWVGHGWIALAPNQPLVALAGPRFERSISLRRFCGEALEEEAEEAGLEIPIEEEPRGHEDS
jgi:hypothetical protein